MVVKSLGVVLNDLAGTSNNTKALNRLMTQVRGMDFPSFWRVMGPMSALQPTVKSPLWDYELDLYKILEEGSGRIAILKCRNSGITTFSIIYALWLALAQRRLGAFIFVTGIGFNLSMDLCRATKLILAQKGIYTNDNATTLSLPQCRFDFFGSDSASWRGRRDVRFVLCDEFSFFEDSQDWRASLDTYAVKNKGAKMILATTPSHKIGGLAHRLFQRTDDNLYHTFEIDWTKVVGKMMSQESIDLLRENSESFPSEFELKWGFSSEGAVYHTSTIDYAIKIGADFLPQRDFNPMSTVVMGVDPGYGSSEFGITVGQWSNGKINILYSDSHERPDFDDMINLISALIVKYNVSKIYVDGANSEIVKKIKQIVNDEPDYLAHKKRCDSMKVSYEAQVKCVNINFNQENKQMLSFSKLALERGYIAINESYCPKLVNSMRTARERGGHLDKKNTSYNDALESYHLMLRGFEI